MYMNTFSCFEIYPWGFDFSHPKIFLTFSKRIEQTRSMRQPRLRQNTFIQDTFVEKIT